jgi:hypothetical protein
MPEAAFEADAAKATRRAVAATEGNTAIVHEARAERVKLKAERRAAREKELAGRLLALPNKRYGVILADPEWKFKTWSAAGMVTIADNHYPTSPLDVIKARGVASISAPDAVLFLWATVPMLPEALEVMAAWGFTYRSHWVWGKNRAGTGYWGRNRHELLLIGTRGNVPAPAPGDQPESLYPGAGRPPLGKARRVPRDHRAAISDAAEDRAERARGPAGLGPLGERSTGVGGGRVRKETAPPVKARPL